MTNKHTRRDFLLASSATALGASAALASNRQPISHELRPPTTPVCISSGNGLRAVQRAYEQITAGTDTALAVVDGVSIVEADPNDMSVGYGGLPNENGVVQLDASVMHGPTHKAGSVAAIENIMHPAKVALKVLQTTDHVMIVGSGAYEFARAHGFDKTDMLTPRARQAWLRWKQNRSNRDDWLDADEMDWSPDGTKRISANDQPEPIPFTYGTIHCAAVNPNGDVSACTTTSGLSYKIPGRVGDSPIIGAGMYVDNEVGSAGATPSSNPAAQSPPSKPCPAEWTPPKPASMSSKRSPRTQPNNAASPETTAGPTSMSPCTPSARTASSAPQPSTPAAPSP
jgi:N4-(beta-N-acetylglucosaminyl)-L-asparaginase